MRMEDMILISVDDHICEPRDMFAQRTPAKFREAFPVMKRLSDGSDVWVFDGRVIPNVGLNAVAGRRPEEYGMEPTSIDQLRPGCWDVHSRIDDMNVAGVLASLNFPSFVGFQGGLLLNCADKDLALAVLRAYNDWHIDEWCGAYPGRFIPCGIVPLWDAELAAEEVRRMNKKGCFAISFPPVPSRLNIPSWHTDYWDPLWKVCDETGVVLCLHISDNVGATPGPDSPVDSFISNMPVTLYMTAADLTYSPILRKYANLRFALSEGGAGWIPHFLERVDYVNQQHIWTGQEFGEKKPSEVFLEHVYSCFITDKTAIKNRYDCGIDNMTWEMDYPHSDSSWPHAAQRLWDELKDIPRADIDKITHLNAMKCYSFDPFRHLARQDCTVGALTDKAKHVDLSYLDVGGVSARASGNASGPIPMSQINAQLALVSQMQLAEHE